VALILPTLDDRTFAGLVEEARALVPALAPAWTNHNPSDPGITLVELFAYLTEMLIYRVDQVPDTHVRTFLTLLNGPEWTPGPSLDEDVRATVVGLRSRWRAVTPDDWEGLARRDFNVFLAAARAVEAACAARGEDPAAPETEAMRGWWATTRLEPSPEALPARVPDVARAHCAPRRNLAARAEAERAAPAEAHVSLIVVSAREPAETVGYPPDPGTAALRAALWGWLDERRTLTTRHHVVSPLYVPVRVEALVARRRDLPEVKPGETLGAGWSHIREPDLRRIVSDAVRAFLDPVTGGPGGGGWPLGRSVFVSDLFAELEGLPGVEYVADLFLTSPCPGGGDCITAREAWNDDGEKVGLDVADHHLPAFFADLADVHVAESFVPVTLRVRMGVAAGFARGDVLGPARDALRRAFPPFGVAPGSGAEVAIARLEDAVRALPGVARPVTVAVEADRDRLVLGRSGTPVAVRFVPEELAEVRVAFDVHTEDDDG
jgi:hypothetical protein